ncbi:carbohydrate ABC transporter permease [Gorillibacterium sp. sgz5001074]|uniref:carbohydrate ABC transporter permease n=1 Tax=Gorillibacterium sp. sgz5001074 TaxID=3446695 RepID=UPI003F681EA6
MAETGAGQPETLAARATKNPSAPRPGNLQRKENWAGILFVSPMLIGVTILTLLPIIGMLILTFSDWNFIMGFKGFKWSGMDNLSTLIHDDSFWKAFKNNGIYLLTVPVYLTLSMALAIIINKHVFMKSAMKVVFFLPYISSVVAVATVWQVLFHPSRGPVNQFLRAIGIDHPPQWIADPSWSMPSLMMVSVWISIGFNMIVYLAGLQSIPVDLYEAADIDGANGWTKFRRITLPLLSPTTFFLLITGIMYSFKAFDLIKVLTNGGPAESTSVLVVYIYESAFTNLKLGYASAMSSVLFLCVLAITVIQWIGQKKWVNY